jgi:hypothetical protein
MRDNKHQRTGDHQDIFVAGLSVVPRIFMNEMVVLDDIRVSSVWLHHTIFHHFTSSDRAAVVLWRDWFFLVRVLTEE